jgi:hypothetical protein
MSQHDPFARFNEAADAALRAYAVSQCPGASSHNQEAFALVGPLARRALNIGRELLQPPAVVTAPPQLHQPAGSVRAVDDPAPSGPDAPLPVPSCDGSQPSGKVNVSLTLREARQVWEREWIAARLRDCKGSVSACAASIGMDRSALSHKLAGLGINPRDARPPNRRRKFQSIPVSS